MPLIRKEQRKWMYANEPEMAEKWEKKERQNENEEEVTFNLEKVFSFSEEDELDEEQLKEKKIMKITKRQLRRIIREEVERLSEIGLQRPIYWSVYTDGGWQDITLTDEEEGELLVVWSPETASYAGGSLDDAVIDILQRSAGWK